MPIEEYAQEFDALLDEAIELAGGDPARVFVVSIPDYGYTPFGQANQASISAALHAFNDTCRTRTLAKGLIHFNITIFRNNGRTPWLGCHGWASPERAEYGLWVDSFVGEVADLLD